MNIHTGTSYSFHQQGRREGQQDARWPDSDMILAGCRLFIVCDGVGGASFGDIASKEVARTMGEALENIDLEQTEIENDRFARLLGSACDRLDKLAPAYSYDMATTLTFVCFHQGGCIMAHIGDSRIYQIRPGKGIVYRSDDHSLVNAMVHAGVLVPDQAVGHPQSNIITRCLSPDDGRHRRDMATVVRTTDVQAGDYFMLCSDGVLHCLTDEQIEGVLASDKTDEEKRDIIAGLSADSEDNNTAIIVHIASVDGEWPEETTASQDDGTHRLTKSGTKISELEPVMPVARESLFDRFLKHLRIKS